MAETIERAIEPFIGRALKDPLVLPMATEIVLENFKKIIAEGTDKHQCYRHIALTYCTYEYYDEASKYFSFIDLGSISHEERVLVKWYLTVCDAARLDFDTALLRLNELISSDPVKSEFYEKAKKEITDYMETHPVQ